MKKLAIFLIGLYQKFLSFDTGIPKYFFRGRICKFNPTCSQYAREAIEKYGVIKGGLLFVKRILRCHPWSLGGNDPLV